MAFGMVYLGLDIGTTHTKAILLDREGDLRSAITLPGRTEVDWYRSCCRVLDCFASKGILADHEIVMSVTGQGGSFVLLDSQYRPIGEPICWTELAKETTVRDLSETLGDQDFYQQTGWPPHGWLAACKLRQIVTRGAALDSTRFVATVPDAIYGRLAGRWGTDITSAQITGLADYKQSRWSSDILAWVGISPDKLAPIETELKVLCDGMTTPWGKMTLVTGSHDQYATMQAAGLTEDQSVMLGTGTAWVINARTRIPIYDRRTYCLHPGRDLWRGKFGMITTLGQIGTGFDRLCQSLNLPTDCFTEALRVDPPVETIQMDLNTGSLNPVYSGKLAIQRFMEWAAARVRSALEQMGCLPLLERLIAVGGAMTSRVWAQIISDVCGVPVESIDFPEFTAWGAASHAMMAYGTLTDQPALPVSVKTHRVHPQHREAYDRWYWQHQASAGEETV